MILFQFKKKTLTISTSTPLTPMSFKKKRICIDARPTQIIGSRSRGIGSYTKNLQEALLTKSCFLKKYEFIFYYLNNNILVSSDSRESSRVNYFIRRRTQRLVWLWNTAYLQTRMANADISLFHATDPLCIVPSTKLFRSIVTLYDVIPLIFPKQYLLPTAFYRKYAYEKAYQTVSHVDAIITLSERSKYDIVRKLNIAEDKIFVIPLAASKEFRPVKDPQAIQEVKKKYQIWSDYILYVGGIDYRKNIIAILKAYAALLTKHKKLRLVIVGEDIFNTLEPMKRKIDHVIRELKLSNRLILTGYVTTSDLVKLYSGARAFIYPSLYEGFGLPILEAMACGCPVICSNTSSFPEVAGEAAEYIDPSKIDQLTRAINNLLTNQQLANKLKNLGYKQAKKFSWDKTATQTLSIYEKVLQL